jgi:hypothetical protein
VLLAVLYVLHQDFWFWFAARPLVFGFLPIGLFYHAAFTLACSIVMWVLVAQAWPAHLESDAPPSNPPAPELKLGPTVGPARE